MALDKLLTIINTIIENKGEDALPSLHAGQQLREDLGLDSLDLAELTVRIDKTFGVDVFEDGVVSTVAEVLTKIESAKA